MRANTLKQGGFSLIELLITSALSIVILSTLMTCYLSIKKSYEFHNALKQIKDTGIIATQLISNDIQHAGLPACMANSDFHIRGKNIEFGVRSFIPDQIRDRVKPKTDVLVITKAEKTPFIIIKQQSELVVPASYPISVGDYLLLTDCHRAQIVHVTAITVKQKQQVIDIDEQLLNFKYPIELIPIEELAYFIEKSTEKNRLGENIYSLHRKNLLTNNHTPDALLEGVENLQVQFSESINNKIKQYPKKNITHWSQIKGVEVTLLLQSIDPYYVKPQPYLFLNETIAPHTRQLHKPWIFYAAIR